MFHAKSRADLPGLEKTLSISGLDFMHSVLRGDLPAPPMAETLNYHVSAVASGEVTFRGAPKFEHATRDVNTDLLATALATELCDDLIEGGAEHLHFYTLNRPELTRDVCHALGVTPQVKLENVA